jgi:hypothetical protein
MGKYWAGKAEDRRHAPLGPSMRADGTTINMDFSYRSHFLKHTYKEDINNYWRMFKDMVPHSWWEYATEDPYGGVEIHNREGNAVSLSSMEFCYMVMRLTQITPSLPHDVLEIGGGYGGFARTYIKALYPGKLTIVDLPPMLRIQQHYLRRTAPSSNIEFLDHLPDHRFQIAISARTFCELDIEEVNLYLANLNCDYFYCIAHIDCMNNFADWKIPDHWAMINTRMFPFFLRPDGRPFVEKVWTVHDR